MEAVPMKAAADQARVLVADGLEQGPGPWAGTHARIRHRLSFGTAPLLGILDRSFFLLEWLFSLCYMFPGFFSAD